MSLFKSVSTLALSLLVATTVAAPAFAQGDVTSRIGTGLNDAARPAGYLSGTNLPLPVIIGNLINAVLGFLGVLLLVYILYGGFLWMTAGGEEKKVTEAKNIIKNAVIGMVIITAAFAITNFVVAQLGAALTGTAPTTPAPGA